MSTPRVDESGNANPNRKRKWKRENHTTRKNDREGESENRKGYPQRNMSGFRKKFRGQRSGFDGDESKGNKKIKTIRCLKEDEVGITEFISENRFFGILKMRYTDFHVNEIAKDGRISKLTTQEVPDEMDKIEDIELIKQELPDTVWAELQKLQDENVLPLEIDVSECTKLQRQKTHECIKILGKEKKLVSNTVEKDNKKLIEVRQAKGGANQRSRERINWKRYGGECCRFLLHKLNVPTMTAILQMSSALRIKPNKFCFAGTKDCRACTTQWFTLSKVHPTDILRAAKHARGVFVGNFEFIKEPLYLGQLFGNRFRIALRNITDSKEEVEKAMISLQNNGFINYFGLQRFGAHASVPSYAIGIALLQGQWEKAINLILTPKEDEEQGDLTEAKQIYQKTKNADEAFSKIRNKSILEAQLLKGICVCGKTNPLGALDWTPRNMRTMYMHSYQSLVWNNMVSRRIKEFGKHPVVGDLVYEEKNIDDFDTSECEAQWDDIPYKDDDQENGETKAQEDSEATTTTPTTDKHKSSNQRSRVPAVKILKEEDLSQYTFADIIMPMPGNCVVYPTYAKTWFDEFLAKDNLTTDLQQKNMQYSLPGNYRNILQIPSDLSWRFVWHKEMTTDLLASDIDQMRGVSLPDESDGQYKSLIIETSLKASTYATMMLREILTCGTSKEEQTAHSERYHASAVKNVGPSSEDKADATTSVLPTNSTDE